MTALQREAPKPTRLRLLEAARAVVEEGGYGAASVAAVAERAGVAAGTLYRHFRSKEELFVELFRQVCDRELAAMSQAAETGSSSSVERLVEVLSTFAERALRRPRLAWALLAEPVDPLVDAERLAYRERYAALVAACLQEAVDLGEIPPQPVPLTAAALVGGCGEALVGPLAAAGAGREGGRQAGASQSPGRAAGAGVGGDEATVAALRAFALRAVGA